MAHGAPGARKKDTMTEEKMVLVREVGETEYGLMFLTEMVDIVCVC
jgi:hypothetical protein